ncbi:MAG: hypothetical protein AABY18_04285 [Candidatus Thermoplasmatota archaeon]
MADWQPFVAAAIPIVLIWVLWRLQTMSVEALRRSLLVLDRHWDQKWLYAIVSWFGTFLHEVSHASVLLLSGHGVKEFRAGVEEGHVLPSRMRGGVWTLTFLVAALAPLFIPPALVLVALTVGLDVLDIPFFVGPDSLDGFGEALRPFFVELPRDLALAIARLDLADWRQALVLALILLGAPGSRPSHVKSRFHGKGDAGDIAALRQTIRRNPIPFVCFVAIVYGAFFAAREWFPSAYWHPMEAVWAVALTGIVLALFGAAFWGLAGLDGRASAVVAWLGPTMFVAVQVLGRLMDWPASILELNGLSVGAWLLVALVLGQVMPRRTR